MAGYVVTLGEYFLYDWPEYEEPEFELDRKRIFSSESDANLVKHSIQYYFEDTDIEGFTADDLKVEKVD